MLLLLPYTLSRQDVLSSVAVRIVSSMSKDRGMTWSKPKGLSQIEKSIGNTAEKQSSSHSIGMACKETTFYQLYIPKLTEYSRE